MLSPFSRAMRAKCTTRFASALVPTAVVTLGALCGLLGTATASQAQIYYYSHVMARSFDSNVVYQRAVLSPTGAVAFTKRTPTRSQVYYGPTPTTVRLVDDIALPSEHLDLQVRDVGHGYGQVAYIRGSSGGTKSLIRATIPPYPALP